MQEAIRYRIASHKDRDYSAEIGEAFDLANCWMLVSFWFLVSAFIRLLPLIALAGFLWADYLKFIGKP